MKKIFGFLLQFKYFIYLYLLMAGLVLISYFNGEITYSQLFLILYRTFIAGFAITFILYFIMQSLKGKRNLKGDDNILPQLNNQASIEYKTKDKRLFRYKYTISLDDYCKMLDVFPLYYWKDAFQIFGFFLIIFILDSNRNKMDFRMSIMLLFFLLGIILIIARINYRKLAPKKFAKYVNEGKISTHGIVDFYKDYFIFANNKCVISTKYCDIKKCVETLNDFYLVSVNSGTIVIHKEGVSKKLDTFIRENFKNKIKMKRSI